MFLFVELNCNERVSSLRRDHYCERPWDRRMDASHSTYGSLMVKNKVRGMCYSIKDF